MEVTLYAVQLFIYQLDRLAGRLMGILDILQLQGLLVRLGRSSEDLRQECLGFSPDLNSQSEREKIIFWFILEYGKSASMHKKTCIHRKMPLRSHQ